MSEQTATTTRSSPISGHTLVLAARVALVVLFFVGWQAASDRLIPKFWIADPISVVAQLATWSANGSLWRHISTTLLTMCLGYGIGAAIGITLGILLGLFRPAEQILGPYISALYGLPKIALAPLLVIVLGIGMASKVALVAMVVVFLALYTTLEGVRNIDEDYIHMMRLMGASWWERLRKIVLPSTVPWIFTGLRLAVSYAFTTTVMGEVLSSNRGLGYLITSSAARFDSAGVFAAVTVLVVMTVIIMQALTLTENRSARGRPVP